jgi:exopolysaccharide production protein ExoQ
MSTASYTASSARPRHPRRVALDGLFGETFRALEAVFCVAGIFLLSGAVFPLMLRVQGVALTSDSIPLLRNIGLAVYLGSMLLAAVRWRSVAIVARRHPLTLALVLLAVVSTAWSVDPATTLRRSFALFGTTLFGLYLAARYNVRGMLKLLATALGIAAVMSVVAAVALPAYGLDTGVYSTNWRGVYSQKNNLGEIMVVATIAFLLVWRTAERRRWLALGGAGLCGALVLLSGSKTGLGVLILLFALAGLFRALRWSYTVAIPALIGVTFVAGVAGVWFLANAEGILTSLGKDATLTGRTPMWAAILDMVARRPWLGYGYSAFWGGMDSAAAPVFRAIGWVTPHAHNGYLDVMVQLGIAGLTLFLAGLWIAAYNAVRDLRATPTADGLWAPLFLTFMILYNITETTLLQQNNIYWALYTATVFSWLVQRERHAAAVAGAPDADAADEGAAPPPAPRRIAARSGQPA